VNLPFFAWEQRKVIDFSKETFGGGTPKTSIKEYWNGEIPWIQSSDLHEHQVSGVSARRKVTEEGIQNSATKLVPKNSIAIVTRVGVGKIALMQFEYTTSQDFLSLGNLKVNEWFGVYSLYNQLQKELHNVQGTSIKGITKNELLDKEINIPTNLNEQNKIGEFFRKIDQTIDLYQKKQDKLKRLKSAYLDQIFSQRIWFFGYSEKWEQTKLKYLSKYTYGGGTPKTSVPAYWTGTTPWIQSSDLKKDNLSNVKATKFITEKAVNESATKLIPKDSIAIVTRVGVGKLAYMPYSYTTSQDFLSLTGLKVDAWFGVYSVYSLLKKEDNIQGTSIKGVKKNDLLEKEIKIPRVVTEQQKIGKFLKQIDITIDLYQAKINKLNQIKQGFLQKMFI
jgi:type I restriction enzyme, S subunit